MAFQLSRRDFVKLLGSSGLAAATLRKPTYASHRLRPTIDWVATGHHVPELVSFDNAMQTFMQARSVRNGVLAVTRNQKLVFARGYTYTDDIEDLTVQPTSLFRIASISKSLTATAILRLVQDEQLTLAAKVKELLTLTPPSGQTPDVRLDDITVRRLLQHLGGWDRDATFDPMFHDRTLASSLGIDLPLQKNHIITYMTGRPLQHTPGTIYSYSNYGYCLLGQIIEEITGLPYRDFVMQRILAPLDIVGMTLGQTLYANRLSNEVKYHSRFTGRTVLESSNTTVSMPYGGFNLENMDSHGGWLASAIDLVRFASTFDDPSTSPILDSTHTDIMFGLPEHIAPSVYKPGDWFYGCGWAVRDWGSSGRNTWHDGSLDGTSTLLVRRWDGLNWCVLFNQRDDSSGLAYDAIDGMLHSAADAVSSWPDHDFFTEYLLTNKSYLPIIEGTT